MFKVSLEMVKPSSILTKSSIKFNLTPIKDSTSSPSQCFFRSESIRALFKIRIPKSSKQVLQSSVNSSLGYNMAGIKSRIFSTFQFLYRIAKIVPSVFAMIGGCHAIYQIYLLNIERPAEKLEVVVLRRSTF